MPLPDLTDNLIHDAHRASATRWITAHDTFTCKLFNVIHQPGHVSERNDA
jgi:hypothetical protein